jgi:hypothetical protein
LAVCLDSVTARTRQQDARAHRGRQNVHGPTAPNPLRRTA